MKAILVLEDFVAGGRNYYAHERRLVSEQDAGLFCGNGWARDLSDPLAQHTAPARSSPPEEITLDVHKAASRTEIRNGQIRK